MDLFWESLKQAVGLLGHLDRDVLDVVLLSLRVSGTAVVLGLVLGLPIGVWLGLARFRGRALLTALANTGLALPPVVVGLFVYMLLSRRGPLGSLDLLFSVPAMIAAQVLLAAPYIAAITMAAIGSVPRDLRLQALALGASRLQAFWLVIREARVSVMAAVVAGFGRVIGEVGAVMMVGGNIATSEGNVTKVMTTSIVEETRKGNYELATALGLVLMLISFCVVLALTRLQQGAGGKWLQS